MALGISWAMLFLGSLLITACGVEKPNQTSTKNVVETEFGAVQSNQDSIVFYVNSTDWADIHYRLNGAGQQNYRMHQVNGRNERTLDNLVVGDIIDYSFTYNRSGGAVSTEFFQIVVSIPSPEDSDHDGVTDEKDQCPGTAQGTPVDANGCAIPVSFDVDGQTRIEAEDYQRFSDTTPNNIPGMYRQDAVDIEITTDIGGGFNVGYIEAGEWLEFDLTFHGGDHNITTQISPAVGGGEPK